jgi:y4mF family transcriptional regulator
MTTSEVENRLAGAGQALLALPHAGCFPAGFRTLWPGSGETSARGDFLPSPAEISAMDEAYRWVGLLPDADERRLVLMRSLVRPGSAGAPRRYVWSWRRLRRTTGRHPDTLKAIWGRGIVRTARKAQGLRQDELAGAAGVGLRFIVDLEAGKPTAQLGKALQVLEALGCRFEIVPPPERKP